MAESMIDTSGLSRTEIYDALSTTLEAVLEGETDVVAQMATVSCLVHHALGNLWTGFYRVVAPRRLKVGPYQGTLGCLDIEFGKGVCGTAAERRETIIVPDVHAFPGHIACDAESRSEIVVPVFDASNELIAVFDLDSTEIGTYGEVDRQGLERLMKLFTRAWRV